MDKNQKFLSDFVVHTKYANYSKENGRRQTWEECIDKLVEMHVKKYPQLDEMIKDVFNEFVYTKKVLPSMRSVQFGGIPIEYSPNRIFNCAYAPIDDEFVFAEIMFLLLGGTGVGYSVRKRHISKLPAIINPQGVRRYMIGDSIEGWADSIRQLIYAYTRGKERPLFDYRDIRPAGSLIKKVGCLSNGHGKLKEAHENIEKILKHAIGRKLKSIEVHDIVCYIAESVVSGGVRSSAMISLFDPTDVDMLKCKTDTKLKRCEIVGKYDNGSDFGMTYNVYLLNSDFPIEVNVSTKYGNFEVNRLESELLLNWRHIYPQRSQSNNSAVLRRGNTTRETFDNIWKMAKESYAGEPGIFWSNSDDNGLNPCAEISLEPNQFCNLTTAIVYDVDTQEELNKRIFAAAFIGTLQVGYTDFHYLRPIWKETTERGALLGVSMTGIASGKVLNLNLVEAARIAVETNKIYSEKIGVNRAERITCIKPEGSGTLAAGVVGSGIHAAYSKFFKRNNRVNQSSSVYQYLKEHMPSEFVNVETANPHTRGVITIPIKSDSGIITREETALDFLERIKKFNEEWIKIGHIVGVDTHNVSATISVRDDEWDGVCDWMWNNKECYNGLSVLPYDGGTYVQAPFEEITEYEYNRLNEIFPDNIDFSQIKESFEDGSTNHAVDSKACSGGTCEI